MTSTRHIIEVDDLIKYYDRKGSPCLNSISLNIRQGEKFGVFGPNGAGKTTLISIMCKLLEPNSGSVRYYLAQKEPSMKEVLNSMGYVPQDFAFYPDLTAEQNLHFFGSLYGFSSVELKKQTDKLLDQVGLSHVRDQRIKTFSGGMKRRVNLAIGLINNPKILFLDEPTVGVDVQSRHAILDLLNERNKAGTTIVYTSHHMKEAEYFCDRIALMDRGEVIAIGETRKLLVENGCAELEELFVELTGSDLRD